LNKMPSAYGVYLGLTGARLDGADCKFLGLADYYIESSSKETILNSLQQADWNGASHKTVSNILENISKEVITPESQAALHESFIRQFEGVDSLENFRKVLVSYNDKDEWINNGVKSFEAGSPSSAYIIFRQLKQGKDLSLEEVFQSELNLSCQCCIHPDFAEGVRALLVDKDMSPKWHPATWEDITEEWIDSYFKELKMENEKLRMEI